MLTPILFVNHMGVLSIRLKSYQGDRGHNPPKRASDEKAFCKNLSIAGMIDWPLEMLASAEIAYQPFKSLNFPF